MKYLITESQYDKIIDKFITIKLGPLEEKISEEYPHSVFWIKNGKVVAEIEKSKYFWVDKSIWEYISDMFSLEYYDETKSIIKHWLENHYNLGGLIPKPFSGQSSPRWMDIII